jgi:hypothetical protein
MTLLDLVRHPGGKGSAPFAVALVDDPDSGTTRLVVMFEGEAQTAVFDLDALIERDDIEPLGSGVVARVDTELRDELWPS